MKWLDSITDSVDMNLSMVWVIVEARGAWRAAVHGAATRQTELSDRTTTDTWDIDDRLATEKMLNITNWRNANQNLSEVSPQTGQNRCHQKIYK